MCDVFSVFFFFCNFFILVMMNQTLLGGQLKKNNNQKCEKALRLRSLAFTNFLVVRKPDKTPPRL